MTKTETKATRAPKGGTMVMGVFYKGGQFLPANEPDKKGSFNSKAYGKRKTAEARATMLRKTADKCKATGHLGAMRNNLTEAAYWDKQAAYWTKREKETN